MTEPLSMAALMAPFFSLLVFVFGACVGSFLNVCIYRVPRAMSVVLPRSHCPHCNAPIPGYLNVPLVSFFALRARCRCCGAKISPRYFLVELLVAVLFLLVWLKFDLREGPRWLGLVAATDWRLAPVYWLAVGGLVLGTFVDFEHLIIPDRVTLGGILAGLLLSALVPALHGAAGWRESLFQSAVGAAVGWGALWGVGAAGRLIFHKPAMGFGDVKLLGAIGAFLGWRAVVFTIVISSLAGAIVGLTLVVLRGRQFHSRIPYGPYLALASVLWILWGEAWVQAYVRLFTPRGF